MAPVFGPRLSHRAAFSAVAALCATEVAALPSPTTRHTSSLVAETEDKPFNEWDKPFSGSFTLYSPPVELRYGEAHVGTTCPTADTAAPDCYQALPADVVARYGTGKKQMAIVRVTSDIVQQQKSADGVTETSVPMWHVYNHHSAAVMTAYPYDAEATPLAIPLPFWTRTADGSRGTGDWEAPNRQIVPFAPNTWYLQYHMINELRYGQLYNETTNAPSYLSQCPCAPQRVRDYAAQTIDGLPFHTGVACDDVMLKQSFGKPNSGCNLTTYEGGEMCCQDGMFVIDTAKECETLDCSEVPAETFYFKTTIHYEDVTPSTKGVNVAPTGERIVMPDRPLYGTQPGVALYAAQFSSGGDYTAAQCPPDTPEDQYYNNLTWTEPAILYTFDGGSFSNTTLTFKELSVKNFKIIKMWPHAHTTIISTTIWNDNTGEVMCKLDRADNTFQYGKGEGIENEKGYVVQQMAGCNFDYESAPVIPVGTPIKMEFLYNCSKTQTGAMATWFFDVMI